MPSISIQIPVAGELAYFEDPSPYYPIWLISGSFDMSPYGPVTLGRGAGSAPSTFCTVDIRIFEDGKDSSNRIRPILKQTVAADVLQNSSTFYLPNQMVPVPVPGTASVTLVAVMDIYARSWTPHSGVLPRKTKSHMVASVCSAPVRFSMVNHFMSSLP